MKGAALPLFGDAYMADTRHLSLEEHGAYLSLLMIAWRSEGCVLPNDDIRIAKMLGITAGRWAKLKPTVMAFWTLEDKGWTQKRLAKERAYIDEKSSKNKSAAEARWSKQGVENKQTGPCKRISKRNAPPPPYSDTNVSGGAPPDPVKLLFDTGVALLAETMDAKSARSLVGRWRKDYGDGETMAALVDCRDRNISVPVEWITKRLAAKPNSGNHALYAQAKRYAA